MVIGEDKSKVSNIVKDNLQHFRILYNNILQECPQVVYKPLQGRLEVRPEVHVLMLSSNDVVHQKGAVNCQSSEAAMASKCALLKFRPAV